MTDPREFQRVRGSRSCNSIDMSGKAPMFHVKHREENEKINDIRKLMKTKRMRQHEKEEAQVSQ